MSMFDVYIAKYYDIRQHQLSRLSHLREGTREMYSKLQEDSRVPQLDKDLEEARLKWVNLAKEHVVLTDEVKKELKLKVIVAELQKTIFEPRNIHKTKQKDCAAFNWWR